MAEDEGRQISLMEIFEDRRREEEETDDEAEETGPDGTDPWPPGGPDGDARETADTEAAEKPPDLPPVMAMYGGKDWIRISERAPTEADADEYRCVMYWHDMQGVIVSGWHQWKRNRFFRYWLPSPAPPPDYRELRKNA